MLSIFVNLSAGAIFTLLTLYLVEILVSDGMFYLPTGFLGLAFVQTGVALAYLLGRYHEGESSS